LGLLLSRKLAWPFVSGNEATRRRSRLPLTGTSGFEPGLAMIPARAASEARLLPQPRHNLAGLVPQLEISDRAPLFR